jgi:tRNA nucleotidyltransferase (CCA-adding enzyme)
MNELLAPFQRIFPHDCHDRILLVGGTVRDYLLQRPGQDYDLIAAVPAELLQSSGFHLVTGKTTTPIWFRCVDPLGKVEVIQLDDLQLLEDDLHRRDFTINAIAISLAGQLFDPLQGTKDLKTGLLRVCSDKTFQDDPLRIFRAIRFEADGWRMMSETEALIRQQDWSDQLAVVPVERFSREMIKALSGREPERFFERMLTLNIGRQWLPELFRMPDIPAGPLEHHPEGDLMTHCTQVLQRAAGASVDPLTRFCAFFHDIGKLATDPACYPKHYGHDEAGFKPALEICKYLCLPTSWGKALAFTSRLHTHLNRWDELRHATRLRIAEQALKAGINEILPVVSAADKPGNSTPAQWPQAVAIAAMNTAQLGLDAGRITAMPIDQRAGFVLQKKVELLKSL